MNGILEISFKNIAVCARSIREGHMTMIDVAAPENGRQS